MANSKIDSIKVGSTTYDITLPSDATPTIASLTTSTLTVGGTSNLSSVSCTHLTASGTVNITGSLTVLSVKSGTSTYSFNLTTGIPELATKASLGTQCTFTYSSNILYITPK